MSRNTLGLIVGLILFLFLQATIILISPEHHYVSAQNLNKLLKYKNDQMGITFDYPKNLSIMSLRCFEAEGSGCGISLFFDTTILTCDECEKGVYTGGIVALKLNESFQDNRPCNCGRLEDFVRWDNDRIMSHTNLKAIEEIRTMVVDNHTAWQIEFSEGEGKKRELIVWAISNNLGYIFSYSYSDLGNHDYGKYLEVFKNMLKSVRFT